jgi:hypothetical protein
MNETVRVYVNSVGVDVATGASALEAVRLWNANEAAAVEQGMRAITDSRGLPVPSGERVYAGAIFRLVSNRAAASGVVEADDAR